MQQACQKMKKASSPWNKGTRQPRYVTSDGYIHVLVPEGYPGRYSNGYVPEHRKVMSEMLGRPLMSGETVHHKNGVRDDNRPENLELWVTPPRSGQRVGDLCEWAESILRTYRPERLADGETKVQGLQQCHKESDASWAEMRHV